MYIKLQVNSRSEMMNDMQEDGDLVLLMHTITMDDQAPSEK